MNTEEEKMTGFTGFLGLFILAFIGGSGYTPTAARV
jgi:hypothetical protein